MKGLSKRHYELFKEIINALPKKPIEESPNQAEIEDKIAEFIQCFFDDNYFGYEAPEDIQKAADKFKGKLDFLEDFFGITIDTPQRYMLPKVKILEFEKENTEVKLGHYDFQNNEIVISKKFISDIACGKESIYFLVTVIGHEFGHFLQYNVDFDELTDQDKKNYLKNMFDGLFKRKNGFSFFEELNNLSDKEKEIIKNSCKTLKDEFPIADYIYTFLNLKNEDRQFVINKIKHSNYLGFTHENDARYRELIFSSQFINDVINTANNNGDKEYEELFIKDKKEIKKIINEVEEENKKEKIFKNYQSNITRANLTPLILISTNLINEGMDPESVKHLLFSLQGDRYHAIMTTTDRDIKNIISRELDSIVSTTNNFVESKKKIYEELKMLKEERTQKEEKKLQKEHKDLEGFLHGKYKYMQKDIDEIKTREQQCETELVEYINMNKTYVKVLCDLFKNIITLTCDINAELCKNRLKEESEMIYKNFYFNEIE